jgi:hypothetical protein
VKVPPHDADETGEEQRLDHHPQKADILPPEARNQLADHKGADHSTLDAPT